MRIRILVWLTLLSLLPGSGAAAPLGSAFSYQGRLLESGSPANGRYDLQFSSFTTPSAGSPAGGPLTNAEVLIPNGGFTTLLDFGTNVFSGANCWLQVAVRPYAVQ